MPGDPYKYYRIEARELVEQLVQGTLDLGRGSKEADLLPRLFRVAHTLKGASRVVKLAAIADLAHQLEDKLALLRDGKLAASPELAAEMRTVVDRISEALPGAEAGKPAAAVVPAAPAPKAPVAPVRAFETVRVEIEEMDRLLDRISGAATRLTEIRHEAHALDRARRQATRLAERLESAGTRTSDKTFAIVEELRASLDRLHRNLLPGLDQLDLDLGGLREGAERVRLLPAGSIFSSLERAVADAAAGLGKKVRFEATGGDSRLDAHVLASILQALLHVVRNAVAHGIEAGTERIAAGKPEEGRVSMEVLRRGDRVVFACSDDGRGINPEAVRRAAVARGVLTEAQSRPFGLKEAVKILLQGGVSTSVRVNQISGRGVGLDMVRETAERFKGEVEVESTPGRGTVLRVSVPILLSSVTALMVESGGTEAAIPLEAVRRSLRVAPEEFVRTPEGVRVSADGALVPFRPLEDVLQAASPAATSRAWTVVLVRYGDVDAALGVDKLIGARTIVSRTLPPLLQAAPVVAGASLDAEGNPQLLLDPRHLTDAVRRNSTDLEAARQAERLPILVIDDSLTTRMMEQSILEAAGYEVELAVSAEEGLEKARKRRCGLFIVDVEMPGMNGFEFVRVTRADETLKKVPAILVTSLNSEADKRRGREAGASDYMVKSEFDQERLLETIRRLIG